MLGASLFGPDGDSCSIATQKVFEINTRFEGGKSVSFSEVDMAFNTFCMVSGCRERLSRYFTACVDVSNTCTIL